MSEQHVHIPAAPLPPAVAHDPVLSHLSTLLAPLQALPGLIQGLQDSVGKLATEINGLDTALRGGQDGKDLGLFARMGLAEGEIEHIDGRMGRVETAQQADHERIVAMELRLGVNREDLKDLRGKDEAATSKQGDRAFALQLAAVSALGGGAVTLFVTLLVTFLKR